MRALGEVQGLGFVGESGTMDKSLSYTPGLCCLLGSDNHALSFLWFLEILKAKAKLQSE